MFSFVSWKVDLLFVCWISIGCWNSNSSQTFVLKMLQSHHFAKEIDELRASSVCSGKLSSLNPFLDEQGVLRVGGRLSRSKLDFCERCPVILPSDSFVTRLIIQMCHSRVAHQGRGLTLNSLRQQGFFHHSCFKDCRSLYFSMCHLSQTSRPLCESIHVGSSCG